VSVEVIETSLIAQLEQVFHPLVVATMPDTQVTQIAGESARNRATREELQKQLSTLSRGMDICKKHIGHQITG
jgi:hypothetical protein